MISSLLECVRRSFADNDSWAVHHLLLSSGHARLGRAAWNALVRVHHPGADGRPPGTFAYLGEGDFTGRRFARYDFRDACFAFANLERADLSRANLAGSSLEGARLNRETRLKGTIVDCRTSFLGAVLDGCDLSRLDGPLTAAQLAVAKISHVRLPPHLSPEQVVEAACQILHRREPPPHPALELSRFREGLSNARGLVLDSARLAAP